MTERGFFSGQRVLVAGGTGLIGTPLVQQLVDQGAYVRIASLDHPNCAHPQAEFRQVDLTWLDHCLNVCADMDYVFNLLCIKGSPAMVQAKPASMLVPMLLFNTNLLEAARRQKVRGYLFTSSVAVYPPAEIFHEDDAWQGLPSPKDLAGGWAKLTGELQARTYAQEYGWKEICVVRPGNVYGPYDNFSPDTALVVPGLIQRALAAERELVIWGDGTAQRDFAYSADIATGMLQVMANNPGPERPINLASGQTTTIRTLAETILVCLGKDLKLVWDKTQPGGDRKRIPDISRARQLGFVPRTTLVEGITTTIGWYLANRAQAGERYNIFASQS